MSVEFDHDAIMRIYKNKRKKFLMKTGHMGVSLAASNSHVDTGASQNAKHFSFREGMPRISTDEEGNPILNEFNSSELLEGSGAKFEDRIFIKAPLSYDVYLERRFGIMKKTEDELIPYMAKFEEEAFG